MLYYRTEKVMKRSLRSRLINLLTILILAAATVGIILLIRPAQGKNMPSEGELTVSVVIECPDLMEEKNFKKLKQSVKDSGLLDGGATIAEETVSLPDGSTAMDALKEVCGQNDLALDIQKAAVNGMTDYVSGIGGLHAGDCTKRSGWVYYLDGTEPDIGLEQCAVSDGCKLKLEFIVY